MSVFFISDLHLEDAKPHLTEILLRFLAGEARRAKALYLLGDIFEVWIGDDANDPLMVRFAEALRSLAQGGTEIFFVHGNRDFMLRSGFAERAGMTLLEDPTVVEIGGIRTLLTHGDRYCTDDVKYQAFRAKSRTPEWQGKMLRLPLFVRRLIARYARYRSKKYHEQRGPMVIADVVQGEVVREMEATGVTRLIHGHTHRPGEHAVTLRDRVGERIVLSDWRDAGEALEVRDDGSFVRHVLSAA